MDELLKGKIVSEISKIDLLIEKSDVLLSKCKIAEPDFIELNAAASVLHSYYGGLENIFTMIYKSRNGKTPSGNKWHTDLFASMFEESENQKSVLPKELLPELKNYLGFRHVFRHTYGYFLDWERLEPLFFGMPGNWQKVKQSLNEFVEK